MAATKKKRTNKKKKSSNAVPFFFVLFSGVKKRGRFVLVAGFRPRHLPSLHVTSRDLSICGHFTRRVPPPPIFAVDPYERDAVQDLCRTDAYQERRREKVTQIRTYIYIYQKTAPTRQYSPQLVLDKSLSANRGRMCYTWPGLSKDSVPAL